MRIIGEIGASHYTLTLMVDSPPTSHQSRESEWLYIVKRQGGRLERQSIGLGMSVIDALISLMQEASRQYTGKRKEFRVMSDEFEQ